MSDYVDIVFDGPPEHVAGRFVEVENAQGAGVKFGEWVKRSADYWALRIDLDAIRAEALRNAAREIAEAMPQCESRAQRGRMKYAIGFLNASAGDIERRAGQ